MNQSTHESRILFLVRRSLFYLVLGFGILSAFLVFLISKHTQDGLLQERSASVSAFLHVDDIMAFSGTPTDLQDIRYVHLKTHLIQYRKTNTEFRVVYIFGQRDGEVFVYADSEDSISPRYIPPGGKLTEGYHVLQNLFTQREGFVSGPYKDDAGTWIIAVAPVFDEAGNIIAGVAIEKDARWHYAIILAYVSIPVLLTLIAFLIVFYGQRLRADEIKRAVR